MATTDTCDLMRPCPLLFPSFTVTGEAAIRYGQIARAVKSDTTCHRATAARHNARRSPA